MKLEKDDMRRVMTVDCGNTMLKVWRFEGDMLSGSDVFSHDSVSHVEIAPEGWHPCGVAVCASGIVPDALMHGLHSISGGKVLTLDRRTPLPISIDYATPSTVGLDRIAGAAGAAALFPEENVLVADAGTALTLDLVSADGKFRGGNISPGMSMRLKAMHCFTTALPHVDADGSTPMFGFDTATAMRSGAVRGMAAEIAATFACASRLGYDTLVLTGGEAPCVLEIIRNLAAGLGVQGRVEYVPSLVAHGLLSIYNYNEEN